MFGFKDWKEYYADGHSYRKLPYVEIPMLIINAEDDPLSPMDCKYEVPTSSETTMTHL